MEVGRECDGHACDHETPTVDGTELDDVGARHEARPERNCERHDRERNDRVDHDARGVGHVEFVGDDVRHRSAQHQIAEAKHAHPPHKSRIKPIFAQQANHAHRAEARIFLASVEFGALQLPRAPQANLAIDVIPDQAKHCKQRKEVVVVVGVVVHRAADEKARGGEEQTLHGCEFARDLRATRVWIVVAPHRGAHGDDARPRGARETKRDTGCEEAGAVSREKRDSRDKKACGDLQPRNERDLRPALREGSPDETREVRDVWRSKRPRGREIKPFGFDAGLPVERLLDDDADRAAFDRAEHEWQKRPTHEFAAVRHAEHGRQRRWMETPSESAHKADGEKEWCKLAHRPKGKRRW